jgi:hypothetical protein
MMMQKMHVGKDKKCCSSVNLSVTFGRVNQRHTGRHRLQAETLDQIAGEAESFTHFLSVPLTSADINASQVHPPPPGL